MKKLLVIGAAVLVALFFGAKMFTKNETVVVGNFTVSSEGAPQMAQQQVGFFPLSESPASTKELTKIQKKLEELGFYSDRFQSIQVKTKR